MSLEKEILNIGLKARIFNFRPDDTNPFKWASFYRMPVYSDIRGFLSIPYGRKLILEAIYEKVNKIRKTFPFEIIAGTATGGIPWGSILAYKLDLGFVYARGKPKEHGLRKRVEGTNSEWELEGKKILLIEDLISTGTSSIEALQAMRDARGDCTECLAVFNYELPEVNKSFSSLNPHCNVSSILNYKTLIEVAKESKYLNEHRIELLAEWEADPFKWGENHGFPKVEKK